MVYIRRNIGSTEASRSTDSNHPTSGHRTNSDSDTPRPSLVIVKRTQEKL